MILFPPILLLNDLTFPSVLSLSAGASAYTSLAADRAGNRKLPCRVKVEGAGVDLVEDAGDFLTDVGVVLPEATDVVRGGGVGAGDVVPSNLAFDEAVADMNPLRPDDDLDDAEDGLDPAELVVSEESPIDGLVFFGSRRD